jgi:hypothetical protein
MWVRIPLLCGIALRVTPAAAPLIDYVTYLGGTYTDTAAGIAVDSTGAAYVAGTTSSPDFPVTSMAGEAALGGRDAGDLCCERKR